MNFVCVISYYMLYYVYMTTTMMPAAACLLEIKVFAATKRTC